MRSLIDHLYRKHARELLVFADRRVGSAAAPDIVQEAYLRLLQHSGTGGILNPRAYLYRVVGQIAGAFAQLDRHTDIDPDARPDDLHAPDPSADDIADSASRLRLCLAVLDELPKLQRHAFLLHRIDGLTHAEVAERLGLSKRTAERYVAKALDHCLMRLALGAQPNRPPRP